MEHSHTWIEITSQPQVWQATLDAFRANQDALARFLNDKHTRPDQILTTGCGSTYYLARAAAATLCHYTRLPAQALPGSELYDMLLKQGKLNNDWTSYATIGDMSKAVSWSEEISDSALNRLRKRAYLKFILIKSIFHPLRVLKIFFNIIRKKEELKTERTLIAFIKRFRQQA